MIAIYKGKQFRRSVGVQSQTTYLRERSQSRFQANENGFWQAGQMDIGVPYEVYWGATSEEDRMSELRRFPK